MNIKEEWILIKDSETHEISNLGNIRNKHDLYLYSTHVGVKGYIQAAIKIKGKKYIL